MRVRTILYQDRDPYHKDLQHKEQQSREFSQVAFLFMHVYLFLCQLNNNFYNFYYQLTEHVPIVN